MNRGRKGNAIASTVLLVTLAGFAALVVDIGYGRTVHYQLEAAADAAAHAAAPLLDGTDAGITSAKASAALVGAANDANGVPVVLRTDGNDAATSDVITGVWDGTDFTPSTVAADVNAVKVTARTEGLWAFFSRVAFSNESMTASASAVAMKPDTSPPGAVECFLPLSVPLCELEKYPPETLANVDFQFSTASEDNAAWGTLIANPSATEIRNFLNNCESQGTATVEEDVNVNNGEVTSGLQEIGNVIGRSATMWDTSTLGTQPARMTGSSVSTAAYGHTLEGPILVFDQGDIPCDSISYVQQYPLVGFAWGVVYDVKATGTDKNVKIRLNNRITRNFGTAGGGSVDAGVIYQPPPQVVQ